MHVIKADFTIDESSFRIDRTEFPTKDEAFNKAAEAARILGRKIAVYEISDKDPLDGKRKFIGNALPDGTREEGDINKTADPDIADGTEIEPAALVAIGCSAARALLDEVSEQLEGRCELSLAAEVDAITASIQPADPAAAIAQAVTKRHAEGE